MRYTIFLDNLLLALTLMKLTLLFTRALYRWPTTLEKTLLDCPRDHFQFSGRVEVRLNEIATYRIWRSHGTFRFPAETANRRGSRAIIREEYDSVQKRREPYIPASTKLRQGGEELRYREIGKARNSDIARHRRKRAWTAIRLKGIVVTMGSHTRLPHRVRYVGESLREFLQLLSDFADTSGAGRTPGMSREGEGAGPTGVIRSLRQIARKQSNDMGLNGLRLRSTELVIVFVACRSRGRLIYFPCMGYLAVFFGKIRGIVTIKIFIKVIG